MTDRCDVDLRSELRKLSLEPEDLDPSARRIFAVLFRGSTGWWRTFTQRQIRESTGVTKVQHPRKRSVDVRDASSKPNLIGWSLRAGSSPRTRVNASDRSQVPAR
jgi:hypothetical protein